MGRPKHVRCSADVALFGVHGIVPKSDGVLHLVEGFLRTFLRVLIHRIDSREIAL